MSVLYLMVGIPGSGKSTFARKYLRENDVWISRDEIRFDLLEVGDEYFAHENKVFNTFVEHINWALNSGFDNVYADATHITKGSRAKLLKRITAKRAETSAIFLDTPLDMCLINNAQREGLSKVPEDAIRSMSKSLQPPSLQDEPFDKIYIIDVEKPMKIIERSNT